MEILDLIKETEELIQKHRGYAGDSTCLALCTKDDHKEETVSKLIEINPDVIAIDYKHWEFMSSSSQFTLCEEKIDGFPLCGFLKSSLVYVTKLIKRDTDAILKIGDNTYAVDLVDRDFMLGNQVVTSVLAEGFSKIRYFLDKSYDGEDAFYISDGKDTLWVSNVELSHLRQYLFANSKLYNHISGAHYSAYEPIKGAWVPYGDKFIKE